MKNIVLVGFMGTGKTVVAKALAKGLKKTYVSSDEAIEAREKKPICDIFQDSGEPYFRKIEKECIKDIIKKENQVIDAGGGVVLDSENMSALKKNGIVICLWADPETINSRTKKYADRPLLNVEKAAARIKELLDYRRPFYEEADFHVDTTGLDVDGVVKQIKEIINTYEKEEE